MSSSQRDGGLLKLNHSSHTWLNFVETVLKRLHRFNIGRRIPRISKLAIIRLLLTAVIILFVKFIISYQYRRYQLMQLESFELQNRWYKHIPCVNARSQENLHAMLVLLNTTLHVLTQLGVPKTVCFGTLWGVLRNNDLLPWDNNIDVCVLEADIKKITKFSLIKEFRKFNITVKKPSYFVHDYILTYRSATGVINSFYDCTDEQNREQPYGNVFEDEQLPQWVCANSMRHILFMPGTYKPLPLWLLQPPFQNVTLKKKGFANIPVPHDGIEIQKYTYPDDWWLEVKLPFCS